jgi:hypothetical protein
LLFYFIQVRSLAVVLKCIGQTAAQAADLTAGGVAEAMIRQFLAPCLLGCRESEKIREAVLTAVSQLAQALKRGSSSDREDDVTATHAQQQSAVDMYAMSQHEELLHSAIAVLQANQCRDGGHYPPLVSESSIPKT